MEISPYRTKMITNSIKEWYVFEWSSCGLLISVAFRQNESLQKLKSSTQSGGVLDSEKFLKFRKNH